MVVSGVVQHLSVQLSSLKLMPPEGRHSQQLQLHRVLWALTLGDPESNNPEFTARLLSPVILDTLFSSLIPVFSPARWGWGPLLLGLL